MTALITGAGGFVGSHLCRSLSRAGVGVRQVSGRRASSPDESAVIHLLEPCEDRIVRALGGVDVVYYLAAVAHEAVARSDPEALAAVNVEAPLRWLRAAERAGTRRFVWLSSIKVLGDVSAEPLRPGDPYRTGNAYARSKQHAEQRLLAEPRAATGLAVVRPPLVYGPSVRGNFLTLLRWAANGLPLPLARAQAQRSMVGIDNLCDLLLRLGSDGEGIFHVADPVDVCVADLMRQVRALLGRPARLLAVPPPMLEAAARLLRRPEIYSRLFAPLRVDASATRAQLAWSPPCGLTQQLTETVAWFRSSR
ncbi:MAG: NAD-dependent epimerase/dehydratase family protein [Pseudomonadales bacterium]